MASKRILAIIGSPKKTGDTVEQVKIFEELLQKRVDFEYLFLSDYELKDCIGCHRCFDDGKCPLKDDGDNIIERIHQADAVIWASPIYAMGISYSLKKLIDRFALFHHRPSFFNKKAFVIVVKGNLYSESIQYLKRNITSWGFDCVGSLGMSALTNMPEKMRKWKIKRVQKLANRFLTKIEKARTPSPTVIELVTFKMWKMRAKWMDVSNADYRFFKEHNLFSKDFFCPIKINILKRFVATCLFQLLIVYIKNEFGDLEKGL